MTEDESLEVLNSIIASKDAEIEKLKRLLNLANMAVDVQTTMAEAFLRQTKDMSNEIDRLREIEKKYINVMQGLGRRI